jgi:antitoxin component YwqK of YwqJK toxin-antitoxin module
MNRETAYVSSIPAEAREKITQQNGDGNPKRTEYYLGNDMVGLRFYGTTGVIESEYSFRNGKRHGWSYSWDILGELLSMEHYENDLSHGTAYQWGHDGRLLGTFTMEHGTGIELWWWEDEDTGIVELHSADSYRDGVRHGAEWLFYAEDRLSQEFLWYCGELHGIERSWDEQGNILDDYPRFWIRDTQATEAEYMKACADDPTLPPFRIEDNKPIRDFPLEVAQHLQRTK